jgi:quinol-cytochrome oxidoreductase complex cytochrome b subunit
MHPYYTVKDLFGVSVFLFIFLGVVFYSPEFFGLFLEGPNFTPADQLATPEHIAPVWYMTPYYAILRAIPNKLLGILAMGGAIAILFFLPWLDSSKVKSGKYRPIFKICFWVFIFDVLLLGHIGSKAPEGIYIILGQFATFYYFTHFLLILPLLGKYETPLQIPESISADYER